MTTEDIENNDYPEGYRSWPKDRAFPWAKMADLIEQSEGVFRQCTGQLVRPPHRDQTDDVIQACAIGHAYLSAGAKVEWGPDGEVFLLDDKDEKLAAALGMTYMEFSGAYMLYKDVLVPSYDDDAVMPYTVNPMTAIVHMNDTLRWDIGRIVAQLREFAAEEAALATQEEQPAEV